MRAGVGEEQVGGDDWLRWQKACQRAGGEGKVRGEGRRFAGGPLWPLTLFSAAESVAQVAARALETLLATPLTRLP